MAQRIDIPLGPVPPGSYTHEILAPTRSNAARLTMTRSPLEWPAGEVFELRIYERERNGVLQNIYPPRRESGGPVIGKDGTVNPPFVVTIKWSADKDRDLLRFEIDVLQLFTTAITVEFL